MGQKSYQGDFKTGLTKVYGSSEEMILPECMNLCFRVKVFGHFFT